MITSLISRVSRDNRLAMKSIQKLPQNGAAVHQQGFVSRLSARDLPSIAALISLSLAIYYNSLSNGFVFDDYAVIVENKHIKDLSHSLPSFFNQSYFKIAGGEASYRPLATLSYFLIHSLAGPNAFYYHLSSVLLHTLNVLFVYRMLCLLLENRFKALLAGFLFACHPALTETVNCIAFNEDLLAACFFLLALILYFKAVGQGPTGVAHLLSLFFFFCGLLSKEMAITLPVIIFLTDMTFGTAAAHALSVDHILKIIKNRWPFYAGYAVICLFYLVLRFIIFVNPADTIRPHFGSIFERLLYLPNHIFSFIKLAVVPYDLSVEHIFAYPQRFFEITQLAASLSVLGLCILSLLFFRQSKEIFFGIWWFLITLFPVFNIIEIYNPYAERYLYLPVIGFCLVVPHFLNGAFSRLWHNSKTGRTATVLVVSIILSAYATIAVARNRDWKDSHTLWSKTVKQSPNSGIAHGSLGRAYQEQGLLDQAVAAYQKAVKLMPNHYKAYYNLGVVRDQQGQLDQAIANYKKSIAVNPGFADSHYNLANLFQKKGLMNDAIYHYRAVIALSPEDFEARNNLGVALAMQGKVDKAVLEWEKVLEIDPTNKSASENIGKAKEILERSN